MGILNVTPDSFSDGGQFALEEGREKCFQVDLEKIVQTAKNMIRDGASVLDIGGESTHPDAGEVSLEEELNRVIPAIEAIRSAKLMGPKNLDGTRELVKISIDTRRSEVAEAAVLAGATMINDVTAGRSDEKIADVAARYGVPLILMHSKDPNQNTTKDVREYEDVMKSVIDFLRERVEWAKSKGVKEVIVDPGMGFFISGNPEYSWEIIERIEELNVLGCPVLVGTSRKSFLKPDRFGGTLLTTQMLLGRVDYLRVHDVFENATIEALT